MGHNLLFDYSFVKKAAVNHKRLLRNQALIRSELQKRFLNDLASRNLGYLCEYYHIELEAHRALNDAVAAHELYQILVSAYGEREAEPFQPKPLVYTVKKESPITPKQLELLMKLAVQYHLRCDGCVLETGG